MIASCRSALLEGLQEGQELVRGTIPAAPTSERLHFSKSLFFQFDVGVEVDLRGIHGLMPQPHPDYRSVHAVLEEVHRGAVSIMPLAA